MRRIMASSGSNCIYATPHPPYRALPSRTLGIFATKRQLNRSKISLGYDERLLHLA